VLWRVGRVVRVSRERTKEMRSKTRTHEHKMARFDTRRQNRAEERGRRVKRRPEVRANDDWWSVCLFNVRRVEIAGCVGVLDRCGWLSTVLKRRWHERKDERDEAGEPTKI
jgi:hypothetical protein